MEQGVSGSQASPHLDSGGLVQLSSQGVTVGDDGPQQDIKRAASDAPAVRKFDSLKRAALGMGALTGAVGGIAVAQVADRLDPALAIYIGGMTLMQAALVITVIGWVGSGNHATLARLVTRGFTGIEEKEEKISEAVVYALDDLRDLRQRRSQRGG